METLFWIKMLFLCFTGLDAACAKHGKQRAQASQHCFRTETDTDPKKRGSHVEREKAFVFKK